MKSGSPLMRDISSTTSRESPFFATIEPLLCSLTVVLGMRVLSTVAIVVFLPGDRALTIYFRLPW